MSRRIVVVSSRAVRVASSPRGGAGVVMMTSPSSSAAAAISRGCASTAINYYCHAQSTSITRGYSTNVSPNCSSYTSPSRAFDARILKCTTRGRCAAAATTRAISCTPRLLDDSSAAKGDEGGDEDECPPWQNPLHHNNPDYVGKVFPEDFEHGEEMPTVPLPPFETDDTEGKVLAPPHLHELADEITKLNMIEVKELVDRIGEHFGIEDDDASAFGGGGDDDGAEEEAAPVEEKTIFDLKLTGFDAKAKIKVIKEIRGITSLGLKEAKELVEGAPVSLAVLICFAIIFVVRRGV